MSNNDRLKFKIDIDTIDSLLASENFRKKSENAESQVKYWLSDCFFFPKWDFHVYWIMKRSEWPEWEDKLNIRLSKMSRRKRKREGKTEAWEESQKQKDIKWDSLLFRKFWNKKKIPKEKGRETTDFFACGKRTWKGGGVKMGNISCRLPQVLGRNWTGESGGRYWNRRGG